MCQWRVMSIGSELNSDAPRNLPVSALDKNLSPMLVKYNPTLAHTEPYPRHIPYLYIITVNPTLAHTEPYPRHIPYL